MSTLSIPRQFQNGTISRGKLYCPVYWLHLKMQFLTSTDLFRASNNWALIGRTAKILAPDWLSTPFLHFVGFFNLCRENNDFFQVHFAVWSCANVCAKNSWKSSATATRETPKGELSFEEVAIDYLCQKLKT